jgi:hypothetical protein
MAVDAAVFSGKLPPLEAKIDCRLAFNSDFRELAALVSASGGSVLFR